MHPLRCKATSALFFRATSSLFLGPMGPPYPEVGFSSWTYALTTHGRMCSGIPSFRPGVQTAAYSRQTRTPMLECIQMQRHAHTHAHAHAHTHAHAHAHTHTHAHPHTSELILAHALLTNSNQTMACKLAPHSLPPMPSFSFSRWNSETKHFYWIAKRKKHISCHRKRFERSSFLIFPLLQEIKIWEKETTNISKLPSTVYFYLLSGFGPKTYFYNGLLKLKLCLT